MYLKQGDFYMLRFTPILENKITHIHRIAVQYITEHIIFHSPQYNSCHRGCRLPIQWSCSAWWV